jgi:hypothetical protein
MVEALKIQLTGTARLALAVLLAVAVLAVFWFVLRTGGGGLSA